MSGQTAAADRLSLTLPDWRTALKKRFRRPRGPLWLLALVMVAMSAGFGLFEFLTFSTSGDPADAMYGVSNLCWLAGWWPVIRSGGYPPLDMRWMPVGWLFVLAALALTILS